MPGLTCCTDAIIYGASSPVMQKAECIAQVAHPVPVSFFSISEVYPPKLKTEEKRLHLTLENVDLYNRAIQDAGLLVPDGALYLVDMHHLTQGGRHQALCECRRAWSMVSLSCNLMSCLRSRQWAGARRDPIWVLRRGRSLQGKYSPMQSLHTGFRYMPQLEK